MTDDCAQAIREAIAVERERVDQLARAEAIRLRSEWKDYAARVVLDFAARALIVPEGDT